MRDDSWIKRCGLRLPGILLLGLALSSCFHKDDSSPPPTVALVVDQGNQLVSQLDSTLQLSASTEDSRGTRVSASGVLWESSDPQVVSIDGNGLLTAHAEGKATVTASSDSLQGQSTIYVNTRLEPVTMSVSYEDRLYQKTGFSGQTAFKPVRYARADVVLSGSKQVLGSFDIDAQGGISADLPPDVPMVVRVYAQAAASQNFDIAVYDQSGYLYVVGKAIDTSAGARQFEVKIALDSTGVAGVYNIYDAVLIASQYAIDVLGESGTALNVYWEKDVVTGTYFCPDTSTNYSCRQGRGIYLLSSSTPEFVDDDVYDDDVIWHEFAHYLADQYSVDDSPGGCHLLGLDDLDMRLAWSEGWGDFFPLAIKRWLNADVQRKSLLSISSGEPLSQYVDTNGQSTALFAFDVATIANNETGVATNYATSEFAVSRVLWGLLEAFEPDVTLSPYLWPVMSVQIPLLAVTETIHLEAFWNGWLLAHNPVGTDMDNLQTIFQDRQIVYQLDGDDAVDGSPSAMRKLVLGIAEPHSLYSDPRTAVGPDVDYIAFDATAGSRYRLRTSQLTNGADTVIKVLQPDQQPLVISGAAVGNNDFDPNAVWRDDTECGVVFSNGPLAMSSGVDFVAPATGTYFVEVKSQTVEDEKIASNIGFSGTGRYGNYEITITELAQ